jgi:ABC-type transport system involved in multi-copper enzyme maturation permease subunit
MATRTAPSFLSASFRIFDLSLGQMLWSRRTVFMALVVGGPVLIALGVRLAEALGGTAQINGRALGGEAVFGVMVWLFIRFTVPVLAVFYGTALIADEVEDKTITYLFSRPITRGAVLTGKYLAYLVCTTLVVLPSVMVVYFLLVPGRGGSVAASFPNLVADLGILFVGLAAYGAVFAFVGAFFKRPVLLGLVFVFGWEMAVLVIPGYMKKFTVAHYLQALVPHTMPADDGAAAVLSGLFREVPALWTSMAMLAVICAGFLYLATRTVERREYVLDQ